MSWTLHGHDQVARKRQQRERVGGWICANENERVRPAGQLCLRALAAVGADHERNGRLAGDRQVEFLRSRDIDLRLWANRLDSMVDVEVAGPCARPSQKERT